MAKDKKKTETERTRDRHGPHKMLRIPLALYEELEEVAEANERPTTWEAKIAIRQHIANERRRRQSPAS